MNYEQLTKLSKNPFYTLSAKQLALLEEYRKERYLPPKKHNPTFKKHGYTPPMHNPKLEEAEDAKTS